MSVDGREARKWIKRARSRVRYNDGSGSRSIRGTGTGRFVADIVFTDCTASLSMGSTARLIAGVASMARATSRVDDAPTAGDSAPGVPSP